MPHHIDPAVLEGLPLTLLWMAEDDYAVQVLDHTAGRIVAEIRAGGRVVWFWTVTGPHLPADLQPSQGDADTLLEAKAAFREKFDRWLEWAKTTGHPVMWIG